MGSRMFKALFISATIVAITQLTGCTLVPVTANLDVPVAKSVASSGPAVKIVSVTDNRKFVYPHVAGDCETPSVDGEKMLADETAKARAFGRQGGCMKGEWAMRTMVSLPEGSSVASVVRSTVQAGLLEGGYRLAESDSNAIPVEVKIDGFWTGNDMHGMGNLAYAWLNVRLVTPSKTFSIDAGHEKKRYFGLSNPAPEDMNESLSILRSKVSKTHLESLAD